MIEVVAETKTKARDFHLVGVSCLQQVTVETKECIPKITLKNVHVTTQTGDALVLSHAQEVLLVDCEVFGGDDGLMISNADVHIKDSDIRFARCRGIFANDHFTVEGVEVSNCGSYGMKTRGGCTRLGDDNDIQPGPWDNMMGW